MHLSAICLRANNSFGTSGMPRPARRDVSQPGACVDKTRKETGKGRPLTIISLLTTLPLHESCPLNDVEIWTTLSHIHACAPASASASACTRRARARPCARSRVCKTYVTSLIGTTYLTTFAATTNRQRPQREGGREGGRDVR